MEVKNIVDLIKEDAEQDIEDTLAMPKEDQIKKFAQFAAATVAIQKIMDALHESNEQEFNELLGHDVFEKIVQTIDAFIRLGQSIGFVGEIELKKEENDEQ